jgi:AraC-like DNA-binding protein
MIRLRGRFAQAVGISSMEYLVAWRMTRAKALFAPRELGLAKVAENASATTPASAFSTAFTRHVGYDLLDPQPIHPNVWKTVGQVR